MTISIEKEYIKVDDEIFYFNSIKNIEFKENKNTISEKIAMTIIEAIGGMGLFLFLAIPIVFYKNWLTILLAIIGIIMTFRHFFYNQPKYEIYVGIRRIYHTENKKDFEEIKEKILNRKRDNTD